MMNCLKWTWSSRDDRKNYTNFLIDHWDDQPSEMNSIFNGWTKIFIVLLSRGKISS